MEEPFLYVKSLVVNFKLKNCCYLAPVRIGLLITAYFNIIYDLTSIVNIAEDNYAPTIKQLELKIFEEEELVTPIPIMCYAAEFAFNVVLLCGIYRKDVELMRAYMNCCLVAVTASILFYSVVIATLGLMIKLAIIFSIIFQIYVILLVRSAIVEMKIAKRNGDLPTLVMSRLVHDTKAPTSNVRDAESPPEPWPVITAPTVAIVDETNKNDKSGSKVKTEEQKKPTAELKKDKKAKEAELKTNKEKNIKEAELKMNKEKNIKEPELKMNKEKSLKEAELKMNKEDKNKKIGDLKTKVETNNDKLKGDVKEPAKIPEAKDIKEKRTFGFLSKKKVESKVKSDSKIEPDVKLESVNEQPKKV